MYKKNAMKIDKWRKKKEKMWRNQSQCEIKKSNWKLKIEKKKNEYEKYNWNEVLMYCYLSHVNIYSNGVCITCTSILCEKLKRQQSLCWSRHVFMCKLYIYKKIEEKKSIFFFLFSLFANDASVSF